MLCPRCRRSTVVEDSRGSESPEAMAAQVRTLRTALRAHPEIEPIVDRVPFRLRRRRCSAGHRTWTVEFDREVLLILLGRLDLDDDLP